MGLEYPLPHTRSVPCRFHMSYRHGSPMFGLGFSIATVPIGKIWRADKPKWIDPPHPILPCLRTQAPKTLYATHPAVTGFSPLRPVKAMPATLRRYGGGFSRPALRAAEYSPTGSLVPVNLAHKSCLRGRAGGEDAQPLISSHLACLQGIGYGALCYARQSLQIWAVWRDKKAIESGEKLDNVIKL